MTTAVAVPPQLATLASISVDNDMSSKPDATAASPSSSTTPNSTTTVIDSPAQKKVTEAKLSPTSARNGNPPQIFVKKEPPSSPEIPHARHRPRKLDLSTNIPCAQGAMSARPSAGPLTARDSAGLAMQDVGLACLSPGFQTQDPTMREQLQRSISVRDQQRHIIESRLHRTAKPNEMTEASKLGEPQPFGAPTKASTGRRRAPPGLSIVPPSHEQFANERVIQSAPLNQTFTGRHQPHPLTRHIANQPSNLSHTSHIHHVPATQTNNRLPPISDVFAAEGIGAPRDTSSRTSFYPPNPSSNSSHSNIRPSFPSPSHHPSQSHGPTSARPREYRSAEEAVVSMSGGREDLLPRIVHYGGHQPPTPPSPINGAGASAVKAAQPTAEVEPNRNGAGRRRMRAEYERDMGSPPLGTGPEPRPGPFGEERDSPDTQRRKKEEFLTLCARAWDLFHS